MGSKTYSKKQLVQCTKCLYFLVVGGGTYLKSGKHLLMMLSRHIVMGAPRRMSISNVKIVYRFYILPIHKHRMSSLGHTMFVNTRKYWTYELVRRKIVFLIVSRFQKYHHRVRREKLV